MSKAPAAPGLFLFTTIESMVSGGAVDSLILSVAVLKFVFFVIAYSFVSSVAIKAIDERKKNDGRSVLSIVFSAIALALVLGALFGVRLAIDSNAIGVSVFGIMSIVLMTLTLGLAILIFALTKKETVSATPVEFNYHHEEPVKEEKPVEEVTPKEEVADAAIVSETAEEEKVEETSLEDAPVEEEPIEEVTPKEEVADAAIVSEATEEEKAEETSEEEAPKEEAAPKKKAPIKKAEENKGAKKNASYHISKRASDNKWQVFRAGSEKVIKLFDTKVEAEEYTKRMAENQGVGYLSHASKGKNKGRIQKK